MRVWLEDPAQLESLVEYLAVHDGVVLTVAGDDELEVTLLGSYNSSAMRMELYLRLRSWEAGRGAMAEIVDAI